MVAIGCGAAVSGASAAKSAPNPAASSATTDWPWPGHDLSNSRSAAGSAIVASDINRLAPVWDVPTPGALTTAALVVRNTVYAEDDRCVVVAVDRRTGRTIWQSASAGFTIGPEGVAVASGRVYATTSKGVEALDERSGQTIWTRQLTNTATSGVDVQPTVVGNQVLMATVPVSPAIQYQGGDRGELYAVNAQSGTVDWSFDTVHSPDLWGNPGVNSGGGAWYPPAVDVGAGVVYWGTANPGPFPGTPEYPNGSSRPGPNLYTDSTVALTLKTGRLRWFDQAVPHDLFDQDFVHTLVTTANINGGAQKVVVGTGKGGQVLGMDPTTGRLVWKTTVGVQENHDLTALPGPTPVLPGTYGGVLSPPAAADGRVYLAALNAPSVLSPDKTAYFGGQIGTMNGEVDAIDAATGRHLWTASISGDPTGGATVVNDLVITGTYQGQLIALDRQTGRVVWTTNLGYGISGWMAIAGDLLVVPTGTVGTGGHLVAFRLPAR